MEESIKETERIFERIKLIESCISLCMRHEEIEPHLKKLAEKTEEVKSLIEQCNHVMKVEYSKAMNEYNLIMKKLQQQQLQFLDFLLKKKESEIENKQQLTIEQPTTSCRTPSGILKENQPKSNSKTEASVSTSVKKLGAGETKMYLQEYLQSPYVRKTKPLPVPFHFIDFESEITSELFETIPKYMRGRETVDDLKNFLDTVLVPCFNEKYQLLHRHRDCIRNHADLELWKLYKDQATYFPGQNFITQGDISRRIKKMLDKKSQNKITMLRHLGILQEQRKAQTICYIWTANNY